MSRNSKRTVTATLLVAAGAAVLIALGLTGGGDRAAASNKKVKKSLQVKLKTLVKKTPVVKVNPEKPTPRVLQPPAKPKEPPKVDVVFALDTTGSMGGLIRGAKRKIWAMANQIVSGQPKPHVRIGLIGYRDLGDAYVTRRYALTEDMEDIYARLKKFRANGGGDTPEHVNKALSDAIRKMQWRKGDKVLRMIFLVGDAPPHEGRGGLYSARLAREAREKGIVVNTVRCGTMGTTLRAWKRIAALSGGMYSSIRQDGAMIAMATPMDTELKELNDKLSSTLLPTGSAADKAAATGRLRINRAMSAGVKAESATYRARSGRLDSKDLLTVLSRGKKLEEIDEAKLPAPVAAMAPPARKAYVQKVKAKRRAIKRKIRAVAKKRSKYIRAKKPKGAPTAFDDTLGKALKKQGKRIGVKY